MNHESVSFFELVSLKQNEAAAFLMASFFSASSLSASAMRSKAAEDGKASANANAVSCWALHYFEGRTDVCLPFLRDMMDG